MDEKRFHAEVLDLFKNKELEKIGTEPKPQRTLANQNASAFYVSHSYFLSLARSLSLSLSFAIFYREERRSCEAIQCHESLRGQKDSIGHT